MTLRVAKLVVVLLLGLVLAWPGALMVAANTSVISDGAKKSCCCSGCDFKHCSTPACCAKPAAPSTPIVPCSLPSSSQNELQALAASVISALALVSPGLNELPPPPEQ